MDIKSNYAKISFNFGPTLLSWMERYAPEIYLAILEADRQSAELRSGHGNAISQVYNHIIMPLANTRDKRTQIIWGIMDFKKRFDRFPEGMWLAETAVDIETLCILAENGIKFTILAPRQADKVTKIGAGEWEDVSGGGIDPTRAYLCRLPDGQKIAIFFYDGPISQAVAFEKLLTRGEDFANRLLTGFSDQRDWPQILNIATDGETYGHHHRHGDMALAYAIDYIENNGLARLTNYGEYLERHPPTHEVQIFENSSWSCIHGVERWRNNCGCNSGSHPEYGQEWRAPLRNAMDWLRDQLAFKYEHKAWEYLKCPWKARDEYIDVIVDRSEENVDRFIERHSAKDLSNGDKIAILELLEVQRHAMLMYTSCGWFFDELSGTETIQIMQYACRAIQLSENLFQDNIDNAFKVRLSLAKSNLPEHRKGLHIYDKFIKSAMVDLKKVAAHYAISSMFENYTDEISVFSYRVTKEDYQKLEAGRINLAVGKISVVSEITRRSEEISFCVLYFGNHALNGGVRTFSGHDAYQSMKDEIITAFETGAFADIVRLMDKHFGMNNYSIIHLFKDEQRKVLNFLMSKTLKDLEGAYRDIYENNRILMNFLHEHGIPVPEAFRAATEFTLNIDIERAFLEDELDIERIQNLIDDIKKWGVSLDFINLEFRARHKFERMIRKLYLNPSDFTQLLEIQKALEALKLLPVEIDYWQMQNIYYKIAKTTFMKFLLNAKTGDEDAIRWIEVFKYLGEMLSFDISSVLPENQISGDQIEET
ncbi:DUF3536 domain-containing protein [Thermodesulfovibrionales bacterium]|nr:DUF3536 domain-containing protein [Thermodesulfovibrionales bacterium]